MPVPSGSPPWIMKLGITRWKIVPSYSLSPFLEGEFHSLAPSARPMKLATVSGASCSNSLQTMVPSEVLKVAVTGMGFSLGNEFENSVDFRWANEIEGRRV